MDPVFSVGTCFLDFWVTVATVPLQGYGSANPGKYYKEKYGTTELINLLTYRWYSLLELGEIELLQNRTVRKWNCLI